MQGLVRRPSLGSLPLLALCAAYLQRGLNKPLDLPGAVAEAAHFGLPWPGTVAAPTIAIELGSSALVLADRGRASGAAVLAGFTMANAFFKPIRLVGAFLLVAHLALRDERP